MAIALYNTLGQKKEPLTPLTPGHVGIYVCGVTVYDDCHIGHARVMVIFDLLVRYLKARGYRVTYVRNFTDIDDKIIQRAQEMNLPIDLLTERFIQAFYRDMDRLGVLRADHEPRATKHITEMCELIQRLLDREIAYQREGDLFFAIDRFPRYGALSGKDPDTLKTGARVAVDERKENPLDFVLWKAAKPDEPRWPAPWGAGRPGWHIECSAMSRHYLGHQFDIHGGGRDLIFPHHENEIAQSEGAFDCHPWVRHWMHNGFVTIVSDDGNDEKMSKSLGNFKTVQELLEIHHPEVLRLFIISSHYRSPLLFSESRLSSVRATLDRLYTALEKALQILGDLPSPSRQPTFTDDPGNAPYEKSLRQFFIAMDDDLNTPKALAALHEIARLLNRATDKNRIEAGARLLRDLGMIFGLLENDPADYFHFYAKCPTEKEDVTEIRQLIQQRTEARQSRHFAEADRIRDLLKDRGILLEDGPKGTTWRHLRSQTDRHSSY